MDDKSKGVIWSRREGPWKYLNGKIRIKRVDI
jgi:hypothetical protein